jgi:integrase
MLKAMKAAAELRSTIWSEQALVVVDEADQPLRPEVYSDKFKRLCVEAGVPVIRLHSLRHSIAFLGHRRGIAPADMAALLGHSVEVHMSTYLPQGKSAVAPQALAPAMAVAA